MIRPVSFYVVVCDRCGRELGMDWTPKWMDAGVANNGAAYWDWHVEGGNHLCPECTPEPDDDYPEPIDPDVSRCGNIECQGCKKDEDAEPLDLLGALEKSLQRRKEKK